MIELHDKSVSVSIVDCFPFSADCNPSVFAIVKSPSLIVGCFVPISVITLVVPITKSPVMDTFPSIVPPVSSYLLSNAVCNPLVFAIVKSPSCISSCFVPISVKRFVVPTKNEVPSMESPVISPVVEKSPCCCEIVPNTLVPTNVVLP